MLLGIKLVKLTLEKQFHTTCTHPTEMHDIYTRRHAETYSEKHYLETWSQQHPKHSSTAK